MSSFIKLHEKYRKILHTSAYAEVASGWDSLIEDFFDEMYEASKDFIDGSIVISEIKEKFGGMRVYVDYNLPDEQILEIEKIVSKYEHLSLKTCTICGSEDSQMHKRKGYWDIVICEECFNKRNKNGS